MAKRVADGGGVTSIAAQEGGLRGQRAVAAAAAVEHEQPDPALGGHPGAGRADDTAAADEQDPEAVHEGATIPPPCSRISAAPRATQRSGSSTTTVGMPAEASILLARPNSSAPPPASRIFPLTTSSARPGGTAVSISCTAVTIAATRCSSAAATSGPGTCSTRG